MNILSLLKRFIPPYRWQVAANLFFNVLSTILSLFSFATIIPVLQILFGLAEVDASYTPISAASTIQESISILKNNLYYYLQTQIDTHGAQYVLLLLGCPYVRAYCATCVRNYTRKWWGCLSVSSPKNAKVMSCHV